MVDVALNALFCHMRFQSDAALPFLHVSVRLSPGTWFLFDSSCPTKTCTYIPCPVMYPKLRDSYPASGTTFFFFFLLFPIPRYPRAFKQKESKNNNKSIIIYGTSPHRCDAMQCNVCRKVHAGSASLSPLLRISSRMSRHGRIILTWFFFPGLSSRQPKSSRWQPELGTSKPTLSF